MARPTKSDIERKLLTGASVTWKDANKKDCHLLLGDSKQRRLFAFLLGTKVRQPNGLPHDFIEGLATAFAGSDDPASIVTASDSALPSTGPWRLQSIETEGFGGLNIWGGRPFCFDFDQTSLLVEGPNGSGKSSLIGAILWALSGERPRDHANSPAHEAKPVFGADGKPAGDWPPIACYPPSAADLKSPPRVRVRLAFQNPQGEVANADRILNGSKVSFTIDPNLAMPSILLETGLLMPARLALLRFDGRAGRLVDAVQKLTGLDDLVALAALVDGLCHRGREYLSYKKKELTPLKTEFNRAIVEARNFLAPLKLSVPDFMPSSTDDPKGEMARFGKMLADRAGELALVVSSDLASGFDFASPSFQLQAVSAIGTAQEDLKAGIEALQSWKILQTIAIALDEEANPRVRTAIATARRNAEEAVHFLEESSKDSRFQLKAVAAQWHAAHRVGKVDNCPLCEHELDNISALGQELEALRLAGDAAARRFDDNLNAIVAELEASLPSAARKFISEVPIGEPQITLINDLRTTFVTKDRYAQILTKFGALVEAALSNAPQAKLAATQVPANQDILKSVDQKIQVIERLRELATWFRTHSPQWSEWWQSLAYGQVSEPTDVAGYKEDKGTPEKTPSETLSNHLARLSEAFAKAEPYRRAAQALRTAWKHGGDASKIEKELNVREAIAESLAPLKLLGPFAEAVARDAIEELSERVLVLHKQIHLTEQLQFHDAQLHRKEGLVVLGGLGHLLTDATLIANTSWLRATLWAFVFALREEAVDQLGKDPFPILVFDDPQSTFDSEHRHRWTQYVASLQDGPSKAQVLLTTHDEMFLELIKVGGIKGRQAMIAAAGAELGHVAIFEGESLDRKWTETQRANTAKAGIEYIGAVRVYVEGLLRLMLRGEDANVMSVAIGFVLGDSRAKIEKLNDKGIAPWDRSEFRKLVKVLAKDSVPIKHMEMAHHSSGAVLGMAEAEDVKKYWLKEIRPALDRAFRLAREHHLLHGGLKALHAPFPTATLPEGYRDAVRKIPLNVLGHAAALSDGRVADGRFALEWVASNPTKIVLAQHLAYRLTALTLEPVARPGDLLLVKESGEPSAKSLVVALSYDRILARRFEIADNHGDVAVLTAQAINPRQIAPPVIAHKATLTLHKIIGVLYQDAKWSPMAKSDSEVCDCGGQAAFTGLATNTLGLVKVIGQSAEPHALDGQYLIVKKEISAEEALKTLDGKPIIAADTDDKRYFKRLRIMPSDLIVLESLDSGGDYVPIVLAAPGTGKNCLERVWPVAGILFELPT
jgi:hypothetical protein